MVGMDVSEGLDTWTGGRGAWVGGQDTSVGRTGEWVGQMHVCPGRCEASGCGRQAWEAGMGSRWVWESGRHVREGIGCVEMGRACLQVAKTHGQTGRSANKQVGQRKDG